MASGSLTRHQNSPEYASAKALQGLQGLENVPETLDALVLPCGLDLESIQGNQPKIGHSVQDRALESACCCLSAQLLGLVASREAVAREEGSSTRLSPEASVSMAAKLLNATCLLLAHSHNGGTDEGNNAEGAEEGVVTVSELRLHRLRADAAREAVNACSAALQGLSVPALSEVMQS